MPSVPHEWNPVGSPSKTNTRVEGALAGQYDYADLLPVEALPRLEKAAGKTLTVIGLNGTSDGIQAVKDGRFAATVQGDSPGVGRETVKAAYALAAKLPLKVKLVILQPRIVTKANVNSIPSWDAEIKAIK